MMGKLLPLRKRNKYPANVQRDGEVLANSEVSTYELKARLERIRQHLERIDQLMAELRSTYGIKNDERGQ